MTLKKNDLASLKKRVPRGWTVLVLEAMKRKGTPVSRSLPSMVLNADRSNLAVMETIVEIVEQHEQKLAELSRRVRTRRTN